MPSEQIGKVAGGIVDVMRGAPVILALLVVNICFIAFFSYLLGQVATNSRERNESQVKLIEKLVGDIRDCRSGQR
jgi:phage gp36-like protein